MEKIKQRIKRLYLARHLLLRLALKELRSKYSGSILGVWWAIISPLLIMLVISFVFTKIMSMPIKNFPLFCLSAILPWFFFANAIMDSNSAFSANAQMVRQFSLPAEFMPVSSVLSNFLTFIIGLFFMIIIFLIANIKIAGVLAFLPLVLFSHLLFTIGLSLLLATINVFFKDLSHLLSVILMFWFWMTPIFYSADMIPSDYRFVMSLNPMAIFTTLYRDILFYGQVSNLYLFVAAFLIGIISLTVGWAVFLAKESSLIKRI